MIQWRTGTSWEHRAYWGLSRIGWGARGPPRAGASRRFLGRAAGYGSKCRWMRPAGWTSPAPPSTAWPSPSSTAARPSARGRDQRGQCRAGVVLGVLPAGAQQRGIWQLLAPRDLRAPTTAAINGQVDAALRLYDNPALGHLSAQERYQIFQRGLEGFIATSGAAPTVPTTWWTTTSSRCRPTSTGCANWCSAPPRPPGWRYRRRWRASPRPRPRWPRPSASRLSSMN